MNIIELILDEQNIENGIEAISVVENPAIEEDFIALNNHIIELKELNKEKQILLGALLIPNKPIYRKNGDDEYYIYFSKETVEKASQMYLMKGNQNNSTLEHEHELSGLSLVESWIVQDEVHDKSRKYGMNVPLGTWMGAVKVNNDDVWNNYVKTGKVKGFSIEGYFIDKIEKPKDIQSELSAIEEEECEYLLAQVKAIIKTDKRLKKGKRTEMESFTDYPQSVSNNAKRGIELNKKVNNRCATQVGKVRAQQLADRKPISIETIKRMFSYLSRAEAFYDESDKEACGTISFLLWGGLSAKNWAESKINQLQLKEGVAHYTKDGKLYEGPTHKDASGRLMTGAVHTEESEYLYHEDELDNIDLNVNPCYAGYEMIGFKNKNGRKVPNCVPIK